MTKDTQSRGTDLVRDVAGNPVIRMLLALIPAGIGGAADIAIDHIAKKRVRLFYDQLSSGDLELTAELIAKEDFLHCLDATLRAAVRARHGSKIRRFARLLRNGMIDAGAQSIDDYEELVGLVDDLSEREWQALLIFDDFLSRQPSNQNPLARIDPFWFEFVMALQSKVGVPVNEVSSFMSRISRTGLYGEIVGAYFDYEGGQGITTPRFARLKALVEDKETRAS